MDAHQALYLRYRPQRFADLVGQEVIATTLQNSVKSGRLSHAYLLTGIRGTGKTSAARILARAINCDAPSEGEPCNHCSSCETILASRSVDVIEIDAATNRGIDEIRDLRERAQFMPSHSKMKVYIIDEAHMLTTEAGNAFLKTLEEPPEHACFILATTEPQKLTDTVLSRCLRFDFRRVDADAMVTHLIGICAQEGITTNPDAMRLVAEAGGGSMRDALSALDRVAGLADGELDRDTVRRALGLADPSAISHLADGIVRGDMTRAWKELEKLKADGAEPRQLLRALGSYARDRQWAELSGGEPAGPLPGLWVDIMSACAGGGNDVRRADDPWMALEAMTLRICRDVTAPQGPALEAPALAAPPAPASPAAQAVPRRPAPAVVSTPPEVPAPPRTISLAEWPAIMDAVRGKAVPTHALLKAGRLLAYKDGQLTIGFEHQSHLDLLAAGDHRQNLEAACQEVLQKPVSLSLIQAARTAGPSVPSVPQVQRRPPTSLGS